MANKRTGQDYIDYEQSKGSSTSKGQCSKGIQTMEIRYDSHGNMTDSCGNSMDFKPPKPYNPDTDKSKPVPLSKRRRRGR